MISIRYSTLAEKRKVYEWLCLSDITSMCMGEPHYPENPVPTWEEYRDDFEDFYFTESEKHLGSVMIIEKDGEEIGCICHSSFHMKSECAELDIWMKSKAFCGKGYGTEALKILITHLREVLGKDKFIIRPSKKNTFAIKSYEKAGFKLPQNVEATLRSFYLNDEYLDKYGEGDYGSQNTATLIIEER